MYITGSSRHPRSSAPGCSSPVHVRVHHGPRALVLEVQGVLAHLHADVAHFAPVLAPRVPDDPVLARGPAGTPADDGDDVVHALARQSRDARGVVKDRARIDAARDGATVEDLLLHGVGAADGPVVGDSGARVLDDGHALAL